MKKEVRRYGGKKMNLFGGVIRISGISYQMFVVFMVIVGGYILGKITIRGVSLGTAGVFIASLLFGAFFSTELHHAMTVGGSDITFNAFQIIENFGLCLFVGSVGMMAGPTFFSHLKKNYKAYTAVGAVIILAGALVSLLCFYIGMGFIQVPSEEAALGITKNQYVMAMITGIMTGALTSTPAFSAAQATAAAVAAPEAAEAIQDVVTTGHGIAYLFGVIGVVLFVQIVPRFLKADMEKERALASCSGTDSASPGKKTDTEKDRIRIDESGFAAFGLMAAAGIFIGMIRIPLTSKGLSGITFSLTTTGGVLISGLVLSSIGHIGPVSLRIKEQVLEVLREYGLVAFLIGTGIPGGASFKHFFQPVYFLFGVIITIVPMVIGYYLGKKLLRLPLLTCLGAITGGMTSTPALGALIRSSGSSDTAAPYAAAYPVALLCIILASQLLILLFGA